MLNFLDLLAFANKSHRLRFIHTGQYPKVTPTLLIVGSSDNARPHELLYQFVFTAALKRELVCFVFQIFCRHSSLYLFSDNVFPLFITLIAETREKSFGWTY